LLSTFDATFPDQLDRIALDDEKVIALRHALKVAAVFWGHLKIPTNPAIGAKPEDRDQVRDVNDS
jgi:hypothetical protein